jgi:hypothetical protein
LLTAAVRYAKSHGGGTVAVASQSEAAPLVIDGARVAGIGGFSGRESETNAGWLAQEVRAGRIRWVLTTGGGPGGAAPSASAGAGASAGPSGAIDPNGGAGPRGGAGPNRGAAPIGRDQRIGSTRAMAAVTASCRRVGGVSGLYDCAGRAAQLAAADTR